MTIRAYRRFEGVSDPDDISRPQPNLLGLRIFTPQPGRLAA
jgi:hypothetical protein